MNLHSSVWTGRAARSLEDAFGPTVRSSYALIVPMPGPGSTAARKALTVTYVLACLVVAGVLIFD